VPSSLLNWTRRLISIRKRYPVFGRGTIEFLHPTNLAVLAYLRLGEGQTVLVVNNLSRFVQPVELDLSSFFGCVPVELFGETVFPRIGEAPYFLSLGPHTFYWFRLDRASA
jgi:maltose alpha-D-glucosyltransferase / alpha-amylase